MRDFNHSDTCCRKNTAEDSQPSKLPESLDKNLPIQDRDMIKKAKVHLELNVARVVKGNKKVFIAT